MISSLSVSKFIDFCCSWGPLILGHNHPDIFKGTVEALSNGASFGAPTKKENVNQVIDQYQYLLLQSY